MPNQEQQPGSPIASSQVFDSEITQIFDSEITQIRGTRGGEAPTPQEKHSPRLSRRSLLAELAGTVRTAILGKATERVAEASATETGQSASLILTW